MKLEPGHGIYTDMNANRRDEELITYILSTSDQWDWEKVITKDQRTRTNLERDSYHNLQCDAKNLGDYGLIVYIERLDWVTKTKSPYNNTGARRIYLKIPKREEKLPQLASHAVFIKKDYSGVQHLARQHGRAPDYDRLELNGDIIVWNDVPLMTCFRVFINGNCVDKEAMEQQCKLRAKEDKFSQSFHQSCSNNEVPLSIGGGITVSRICMFFLQGSYRRLQYRWYD